jgi:hypothetical protein
MTSRENQPLRIDIPRSALDDLKFRPHTTRLPVLDNRTLNRTTLMRQLLLRRHDLTAAEAVERLVGLQAQATSPPYVALWSRLKGFRIDELSGMINDRSVVRTHLMRGTLHLVTGRDCLALRPVVQPVLHRSMAGQYRRDLDGVDRGELAETARRLIEEQPLTTAQLGELLHQKWPHHEAARLGWAVPYLLPLVQVPPRGVWGRSGPPVSTTAASWLGTELPSTGDLDEVVLRYLAVFGPATVADIAAWSRMTGLRGPVERLRPRLRVFHDERGRELFDVPDAPIASPDVPAPPRFLPEFDNVLLSHADRTRVISDDHRKRWSGVANGVLPATFLIDGFVRGTWKIERQKGTATLVVTPYAPLSRQDRTGLAGEGAALLAFAAAGDQHDVRFTPCP